jgi:hypothetical protein
MKRAIEWPQSITQVILKIICGSLFTHNVEYCLHALDDVVVRLVRTEEESKHEKALEKKLDECLVKEACDSFRT